MTPKTRYAKSGEIHIAYQMAGSGPPDLVFVPGWVSHLEAAWEEPIYARFLERLASFSRLIMFDKRGTGMSDRDVGLPTLEERMDDVRAVMDTVGSERAAIFGTSEGGNMSLLFAATYPERTVALVTFGVFAKRIRSEDYPWAPTPEERERWYEMLAREWGDPAELATLAPSKVGDGAFAEWWARYLRMGASPRAAQILGRTNTRIDVTHILPTIAVPTLVLHRTGDRDVDVGEARYIADRIPGARLVELPGDDHLINAGDTDAVAGEIEEFLTGVRRGPETDRVLTTILLLDIVGSTDRAAELGDRSWGELLESFRAAVRGELARRRGRELDTAGDGFLAMFDGPARAVRAALAVRDAVGALGLQVRAGLHTGEVEVTGEGVAGIAVHIAARVMAEAGPSEVLVSRTVTDLVAGSGLGFEDRGERRLKGVPGSWRLYAATGAR
ncbi:MAG TPA: adenylate/guanylate cyclase domain-containing protein [Actinomycetota bacterium]